MSKSAFLYVPRRESPIRFSVLPSPVGKAPTGFQRARPASGNRVSVSFVPVPRRESHFPFPFGLFPCRGNRTRFPMALFPMETEPFVGLMASVRRGGAAALLRVVSHGSRRGTASCLSPFKELFHIHIQSRLVEFACREADAAGLFDVVDFT